MTERAPLRILHCFRSPVGGIFRHVRDLVEEHRAAGHEVGILCDSLTGGAHEERLFDSIRPLLSLGLSRTPMHRAIRPSDTVAIYRSYKHIKSLHPNILHGHGAKGGALARMIGSALRVNRYCVARLYSPHGGSLHFDRASLAGQAVFRMEHFQEHLGDATVFVCDYERRTYEAKVGIPRKVTRVIYNGIKDTEFVPVEAADEARDFLYIGMMRDLKGPDVFIEALVKAETLVGRRLSAFMVGDGPDRDRYQAIISSRGLEDRIEMRPAMPAREAFALAKTVVVPSRAEAMPYIVLEALAAQKGVIASRVGGIPEVLGEQSPALAIPGDPDDLARIMATSMTTPGWHEAVMPKPEHLKTSFSASVMASEMLDLYQDLLKSLPSAKRG